MRNRLIIIIQEAVHGCSRYWAGVIADKLLSSDVIISGHCKDCALKEPSDIPGKVWCKRMGRYMNQNGYCSEGECHES